MAAIADLSALVNRLTGGNSGNPDHQWFWVDSRIGSAAAAGTLAGRMTSLWRHNKSNGANGAVPGTVAAPNRSTIGALGQSNPSGGREKWLLGAEGSMNTSGTMVIYDRLLHIGGLSAVSTSAQSVGGALTRNTAGVGNQIWLEVFSQIGSSATTVTVSYTNESGVTGRTTNAVTIGGTGFREESRLIILPLQDGDKGVQSVQSVTLASSTGTAGDFGVTVARPLMSFSFTANGAGASRDAITGVPAMPKIDADACIAFAWMAATTIAPSGMMALHMVEG